MTTIQDPVTRDAAHVTSKQRLSVLAVSETERAHAGSLGWKFTINTGDITITNSTKVSLLYVKNTGVYDMAITRLIINAGTSTDGAGDYLVDVLRNPTAGDIITNANQVRTGYGVGANNNFGSTNVMTGDFFKGAQGETALSGGDGIPTAMRSNAPNQRLAIDLSTIVIPRGQALGVDYTPAPSNTSQTVQIVLALHIRHPDVVA
jgi:hypothetical protein